MAIAVVDPAPAAVITWARGSAAFPAAHTPGVLVRPVGSTIGKPAWSTRTLLNNDALVGGGWSFRVGGLGWFGWAELSAWRACAGGLNVGVVRSLAVRGPVSGEGPAVGGVVEAEIDEAAEVDGGDAGR